MRSWLWAGLAAAFAVSAASSLAEPPPAPVNSGYQPPRTPDGRPDFQGVWSYRFLTPVEKALGNDLVVSPDREKQLVALIRRAARALGEAGLDPEAVDPDSHSLARVKGEYRTRQIVEPADGLLPYTPEALKLVTARQVEFRKQFSGALSDGPEQRLTWERCLAGMGQAPLMTTWAINMARRIVQTKDDVVIWSEAGGETRIIRIGGKPGPSEIRTFLGESVAHWDGDTLVVETTGFRPDDGYRLSIGVGRPILIGPDSKVVERFSRVSDDELLYQFTVVDPAIYARPWLAEYSMLRSDERTYEFACHEGNYGLADILKGARMTERRASGSTAEQ
ncbi:MAG: hypothetical protein GC155_03925 [Alphaproteobacteria bacterium]|nr:hypothetical protein [Alphaproteobacteria bacterium]